MFFFRLCALMVAVAVNLATSSQIWFKIVYTVICDKLPNPSVWDAKINNLFCYIISAMPCDAVFYGRIKQYTMDRVSFLSNRSVARVLHYFMRLFFIGLWILTIKDEVPFKNALCNIKLPFNSQFSWLFSNVAILLNHVEFFFSFQESAFSLGPLADIT